MKELTISPDEASAMQHLACSLCHDYRTSDSERLLHHLARLAQHLPQRINAAVKECVEQPDFDFALIRQHVVIDAALGPTPRTWKTPASVQASLEYEMLLMLYGAALGTVFGWTTQQDGHIVNDLVPIPLFEKAQVGASSRVELAWHTEDAFHPGRADFICLFCLRNPKCVPTTVASLNDALNGARPPASLFQACVRIIADDAQQLGAKRLGSNAWTGDTVEAVPILTQTSRGITMCIDPAYMSVCTEDRHVRDEISQFCSAIEQHMMDVVLRPGDLLILDNRHVVHGRRPFRPSYDGCDRWLKRVNVASQFDARDAYCTDPRRRLLA